MAGLIQSLQALVDEVNAKHNFVMLTQSLDDQLKFDNKDKDDETAAKTAALEIKSIAEGDI